MGGLFHPLYCLDVLLPKSCTSVDGASLYNRSGRRELPGLRFSSEFTGFTAGKYQWDSWFWRSMYFLAAILVFLLAASNPIDVLSGTLFWVHMVQHLLLLVVMAPLLVAGAPLIPVWLGLPDWVRGLVKAFAKLKIGRAFYHDGTLGVALAATTCHLMCATDHRHLGVALAAPL